MRHSILPFPADIDRDAFGHWLSGFVDGEGCSLLKVGTERGGRQLTRQIGFVINLRLDDVGILRQIQSYWKCGRIRQIVRAVRTKRNWDTKPTAMFTVADRKSLSGVVVPHFQRYPLR